MTDINTRGATADEWFHFDFNLGLGGNLLPCVPAGPDVRVLAGSALEGKVGKIPSQFNRNGEAHGLKEWQKREILSNELQLWQADRRLNLCVRTGPISGVYAIDVDIDDLRSDKIFNLLDEAIEMRSSRVRENSRKFLVPFRMDTPCKKRVIKLDNSPRGPRIELLAEGQQFVAAGSHSSGMRYQWMPGLPDEIPTLTLAQVNQIWATLTQIFATPESRRANLTALVLESNTGANTAQSHGVDSATTTQTLNSCSDGEWTLLQDALNFLRDKVADNDTWSEVGYALLSLQNTRPAEALFNAFSKSAVGYEEGAPETWWAAHRNQPTRTDFRHIIGMARKRGMANVADSSAFQPVVEPGTGGQSESGSEQDVPGTAATVDRSGDLLGTILAAPTPPIVRMEDGNYSAIIDQLEALLVPEMYSQGPGLTRQSQAHTDGDIRRKEDALMLVPVSMEWLKKRIGEIALVEKMSKDEWRKADIRVDYVTGILNLKNWTKLRPLDALARAPFVRADGSICDRPGYDPRARVLYVPGTEYPAIPSNPDQDCAREALERIRGVFDQFPWKEPASESAFLSHILAEAARLAIDRCPMYFYDAPSAGTGKGLLQEMAARIVHGCDPALRAWVGDGDEIRKALYAAVLAGDRSLWFDNIPDGHKVRSSELCAFITSSTWTDRKLGESQSLGVPNKMVLVGSGNNITPVSDLARRSIVVRMDANTEKLKDRVFKIPEGMLRPYVMEHRPQMLVDALTIIKAYHTIRDSVKDDMPVPMQSFGQWSRFCREPLLWLDMADPVATQKETDDETGNVGSVYLLLAQHFGSGEFTCLDIARVVNGLTDPDGHLANALVENGCKEPNNPKIIGYWMRQFKDRISNGLKLVHLGRSTAGAKWRLKNMNEDLTSGN